MRNLPGTCPFRTRRRHPLIDRYVISNFTTHRRQFLPLLEFSTSLSLQLAADGKVVYYREACLVQSDLYPHLRANQLKSFV